MPGREVGHTPAVVTGVVVTQKDSPFPGVQTESVSQAMSGSLPYWQARFGSVQMALFGGGTLGHPGTG